MNDKTYSVGEASAATGVSSHTLRYYERAGLLTPVKRGKNGHRLYTQDDLNWVRFLTLLRVTGMPIAQMRRYMELIRAGAGNEAERLELFERHREDMLARIGVLTNNLSAIERKIAVYKGLQDTCVEPGEVPVPSVKGKFFE